MKILSKKKDCYDYLTGIYGKDERLFLDRRGWEKNAPDDFHHCDVNFTNNNPMYDRE